MPLKTRTPTWLSVLKDYWWLGGIVAGGILFWGNLPERVKKVEAGQANQQEELTVIRDATKEIQGYLKGQQALNERLAAQQATPATQPLAEPQTPVGGHPEAIAGGSRRASPAAEEVSDDGEVKVLVWTDEEGKRRKMCCEGTSCWPWRKATQCQR